MIFQNDIGVVIQYTVSNIDISSATNVQLKYEKPDGTTGYWSADVTGTNVISYQTVAGDLNQVGKWEIQPFMTVGDWTGHADKTSFIVNEHL